VNPIQTITIIITLFANQYS